MDDAELVGGVPLDAVELDLLRSATRVTMRDVALVGRNGEGHRPVLHRHVRRAAAAEVRRASGNLPD